MCQMLFRELLHNFRKNERSLERSYIRQWKSVQKYQPRGGTDSESVPKRVRSLIATNPGPSFRSPNLATNGKERRARLKSASILGATGAKVAIRGEASLAKVCCIQSIR